MTRRWRPPHPAQTVRPTPCPHGPCHRTRALALAALVHGLGHHAHTTTPCDNCGGWRHERSPE